MFREMQKNVNNGTLLEQTGVQSNRSIDYDVPQSMDQQSTHSGKNRLLDRRLEPISGWSKLRWFMGQTSSTKII